ncbi:LexA family transcriptional regulator [Flavobacterium zepuense]|uniref:LexA family transcriptional regulator n=1 Tax=Flavobacterium zepuense TaxID=2593302 RepID=A0A552V9E0_9FLAO|nr:LexA family transcriptional regulator [Flavobacterium zepuense]TRW27083.1 LexA family transcriptional regulator [Flavobacterium zepuense]
MSLFSDNIRFLRTEKKVSQDKVAEATGIPRSNYAKYELGYSEAPHDALLKLSRYYHCSIDLLLSVDVRKVDFEKLLKLDDNRILLPITVDSNGDNVIEVIPHKAKAGYLSSYSDPEFIESLQHLTLPFLKNGKFRAFPVEGDSMPPHKDGSFIVGRYIENLGDVLDGKTYVLLTKSEGIVYKRLIRSGAKKLTLQSDNSFYKPYEIRISEVLEIWEYTCSIATKEFTPDDLSPESITEMFLQLQRGITEIRETLKD